MRVKYARIPIKPLEVFIKSADLFLQKTQDSKLGLEVRMHIKSTTVEFSVGADAKYIQAEFVLDELVETPPPPVFLDLKKLSAVDLRGDILEVYVPQEMKDDHRVQFKMGSVNFRIQTKGGGIWKRNHMPFPSAEEIEQDYSHVQFTEAFYKAFWEQIYLPNSYKMDKALQQIVFEVDQNGRDLIVHSSDGLGAFCHRFEPQKSEKFFRAGQDDLGPWTFVEDFFSPLKYMKPSESGLLFSSSRRQNIASLEDTALSGLRMYWAQPRLQKAAFDTPTMLQQTMNTESVRTVLLDKKGMQESLNRVTMFMSATEIRTSPVAFSSVGKQYSMWSEVNGDEVTVEGELIEGEGSLEIMFQSGVLRDYLAEMNIGAVHLHCLASTAVLAQTVEHADPEKPDENYRYLCWYWMTILPSTRKARAAKAAEPQYQGEVVPL